MELSDALEDYIVEEELRLKKLRSFSEEVKKAMSRANFNRDEYIGHPVNTYQMIKRLVKEWTQHVKSIEKEGDAEGLLFDRLENYRKYFPGQDDLEGAMAAIKRLQEVYNLKPFDFTGGKYGIRTDSGSLMTAMDAFKFGRGAFVSEDMESTRQWMAESLRLLDMEPSDQKEMPNRFSVLDHLAWSSYQLGDVGSAINYTIEALKVVPNHERSMVNLGNFRELQKVTEEEKSKEPENKERRFTYLARKLPQSMLKNFDWFEERRIFKKLCRGDPMPHAPQSPERLRCYYKTDHPLCTIKRCPIEVVFTNPDIMILHNIMSDAEIDKIIKISKPLLNRATVHNPITGKLEYAQYRISKNCWLNRGHDELIDRVNARMSALTGLNLQTAEDFQVQNYGLAGHYDPHFDFSRDLQNSTLGQLGTGNRIATVLLYFTDVEAGGATVFPYVGARVKPKKGDAVFWHNLLRSGEGDFRTRHAGCPVLKGWKWVSNKWIHEYGNEFKRPCSLSPEV
ncbi:hypothetical protein ACROYT_G035170 [Oculina patagonica]